jgi:hypothetical protein
MRSMHAWHSRVYAALCPIFDEVTVSVSQGDMVEYNQCQATLKTLYELGIPGKVEEFTAYRILMLLHGRNKSGASFSPLAGSYP